MLDATFLDQRSDQNRKYQSKHKEKAPQDSGRIGRQQHAKIFYERIGNQIDKTDQGGLKRHGIYITGVQGKFAGRFGLIAPGDDSGQKIFG